MGTTVLVIGVLLLASSVSTQDLSKCVDVDQILQTAIGNPTTCAAKFIASMSKTELQPFCDDLFDGLECVAKIIEPNNADDCYEKMIAFIKEDPSSLMNQINTTLSALEMTIELRFAAQVGQCNQYKDLSKCVDVNQILQTAMGNPTTCAVTFIASVSKTELQPFCDDLFDGLECVAKIIEPNNGDECYKKMIAFIKEDPSSLMNQIKALLSALEMTIELRFAAQVGQCNQYKDGDGDSEDDDDIDAKEEEWNTACPKIETEGGLCPQDVCTADAGCPEKHTCCSVGGANCRQCYPDLRQCGNLVSIFANVNVRTSCVPQHILVWRRPGNAEDYCRSIWALVDCLAEKIMPGAFKNLCYERMAMLLWKSPKDLILALQGINNNIKLADIARYIKGTVECEESPFSRQVSRPELDEVKSCFNRSSILKAAGQCGRLTGSSATSVNCANLMSFIECIGKKLSLGKDENVVRKCSGEVYEFVKQNRQNLQNTFGNIDPEKCQERKSVCGDDLTPLDGVDCKSARCPGNYECKEGFCCPIVRMGYCPNVEPDDRPVCKKACKMDAQCEDDEKCCDGCGRGTKYCMKMETEPSNKSKCEAMLAERKKLLLIQGICGDGTGLTKLPSCQNKRFSPLQLITETGRGYCVTEDGRKINGSDFIGNRDCTKVREGSCPPTPAECQTVESNADTCQSNDLKCQDGQKCCTFYEPENQLCLKKCTNAQKAREQVVDDCPDRKCCPITLCQNKICLKDKTARCSINSCGKCEAEFYNIKGEKVDCNVGVPVCLRKRALAREENAKRRTSDYERLSSFMQGRDNREMGKAEDEHDDDDDDDDDDDMMRAQEFMRDEYGVEREDEDKLPDDQNDEMNEEMEKTPAMIEAINRRLCAVFDNFELCQNGGTCKIGSGESFWEVCKCATGYSGLFCETPGAVSPKDTMCNRDSQRVKTIISIMMGSERVKEQTLLQEVFNKLKPPQKIMPTYTCDANGDYEKVQMGMILPHTLHSASLYYCVDTSSGVRMRGTPVTLVETGVMPDCTVTDALPDIMSLPRKCMVMNMTQCSSNDECEYFWNQETGTCDKGKAMGGFIRLTDCYDTCSIQRGCTNDPTGDQMNTEGFVCQKGVILGPKPCRMADSTNMMYDTCDYEREFCDVTETASGHTGMCKTFPKRCLDRPESGYGDKRLIAYYYNATTRTCKKFHYRGMGGLLNRFYSLQQCHTECNTRMSKYDDAVCPIPKMLEMSMEAVSNCDGDADCDGDDVCCYNGKGRMCTSPVRTCASGVRCSLLGSCLGEKCVCDDCTDVPVSQVCGTDGQTYQSVCHLRRKSCQMMQNITVAFNGTCRTKCGEKYCETYEMCENNECKCGDFCITSFEPVCGKGAKSGAMCSFGNECEMNRTACKMKERYVKLKDGVCSPTDSAGTCRLQCTKEYMPVCVYDTTPGESPKQETYSNTCLLKEAMLNGKKLQVLSPGPCYHKCGASVDCPFYKTCMNGECKCQDACTKDYRPVCAHPQGNDATLTTFSNICLMKQQACADDKLYIIVKHGPCKEPEPVLECPKTRDDMPFSGIVECKTEDNDGCDTEMGEKCCPYGTGKKCTLKEDLVRKQIWNQGICPPISGINFDDTMCDTNKCMHDDDCAGEDSKCCENSKCGHMTCSASIVKPKDSPCSLGSQMVSLCDPNATVTGCVQGGTCTVAQSNVAVCCVPVAQLIKPDAEKTIVEAFFCQLLATAGITCANGGTCIGNIRQGKVCQCKDGYFGPLCRDYVPTNCDVQAVCVANPCDVTKCPAVPDATCEVNTCEKCSAIFKNGTKDVTHLCNATPCLVQKPVMKELEDFSSKETEGTDEANCDVQAVCVANPCDVTKCPAVPDATCEVNTCEKCSAIFKNGTKDVTHLCNATPCLVQKPVMKELEDFSSKETEGTDEAEGMQIKPFTNMKLYLMKLMGMLTAKVIHDDLCATDGHFKPEQCALDMRGSKHCYCVNTKTGLPIPNGPEVTSLEGLDCSALNDGSTGIQKFCFQQPSKRRCHAPIKRFFFNTRTMDCEQFHYYGCDFESGNNFVNYKTCKNACGVISSRLSKCAAVRCGSGKQCRMVDGSAVCQDPDNITAVFEPICDDDGNFHPKQCHGEMCKCVNPTNGELVPNSEAAGQDLMCEKDGNTVKVNRTKPKVCEGNREAVFCENGGNICKNCELDANRETQRNQDEKVDDKNVCKSCKTCSAGQGSQNCKIDKLCVNKCEGFPTAVCRVNKCACEEEYFANDQKVNCSELHTDCEIERHNAYLEEKAQALRNNGKMPENRKQIKCSKSNGYLALCQGNKCQCLNASDGTPVGDAQTGKTLDTIDCNSVQRKTKATSMDIKVVLSKTMNLNQLSARKKEALKAKFLERAMKKYKKYATVTFTVKLIQGSIVGVIEISSSCVTDCPIEITAIGNDILRDVDTGVFVVEAEDQVFVASEGSLEIKAEEAPTTKATPMDDDDDDDDKTTTIIIVVVVVAVVGIIAIAVACYCYKKASKSRTKDIPFSDIQGNSNPAYGKA